MNDEVRGRGGKRGEKRRENKINDGKGNDFSPTLGRPNEEEL